jgi:hypothetical protein
MSSLRDSGNIVPLFQEPVFKPADEHYDIAIPRGGHAKSYTFALHSSPENAALALAHREDFFAMCKASLWGAENPNEFGQMLRGLVEAFCPKNRWHLELLANIADAQWRLRRVRKLQGNVFAGTSPESGKHGVSMKTLNAMEYDQAVEEAMRHLAQAVAIYKKGG